MVIISLFIQITVPAFTIAMKAAKNKGTRRIFFILKCSKKEKKRLKKFSSLFLYDKIPLSRSIFGATHAKKKSTNYKPIILHKLIVPSRENNKNLPIPIICPFI